jgi:hypothetical protein
MMRAGVLAGLLAFVAAQTPAPVQIQNGRVEVRQGAAIDREIAAVSAASSTEPVWVAWRTPLITGDRDICDWYSDRIGTVRGIFINEDSRISNLESRTSLQITPPTGPVPLEAGTGLVVLARAVGGQVERLRTLSDDCPMDAGGRTVYWLGAITSAESLRFLNSLTRPAAADRSMFDDERQIASSAVRAIGFHRDAAADAMLDTLASDHADSSVRRQAATTLSTYRGAHGAASVTRLIGIRTASDERRSLVTTLAQSREAPVVDTFRSLSRDPDARVRAEAAYYFVVRGGAAVVNDALKIATADPDDNVRRRVVAGIARLPDGAGVTALIDLARTTQNAVLRKEAVSALSQSKDPRAVALMVEIIK